MLGQYFKLLSILCLLIMVMMTLGCSACIYPPTPTPTITVEPVTPTPTTIKPVTWTPTPIKHLDADINCVYIDHHIHVDGVLLEGERIEMMIDFPTYQYDPVNRKLEGYMGFEVNDSLLLIYGDGISIGGAMGGGASTMLSGAYVLPYSDNDFTVSSITENGTVVIGYNNETILLLPGENWTRVTSEVRMVDNYRGGMSRINVTTTDQIMNYGLLSQNDIINTKDGQTVFY